jgi:hypothetical protein
MKAVKSLMGLACSVALFVGASSVLADQSCCVKSKAQGKDCEHKCCVDARKEKKTCEKCQKNASCCDKAIAQGKECAHQCCADATKEKKVCEKCNKKEEPKAK